jgi:hypothetical protein
MVQRFRLFPTVCLWSVAGLGIFLFFPENPVTQSDTDPLLGVAFLLCAVFDVWRRLGRVRLEVSGGFVNVNRGSKLVTRYQLHQFLPWSFHREAKLLISYLFLAFLLVLPGTIVVVTGGADLLVRLLLPVGAALSGACIYDWRRLRSFVIPTEYGGITFTLHLKDAAVLLQAMEDLVPPTASAAPGASQAS